MNKLFYRIDCWKYRDITVSVETKNQGTDHQVANVRETGDGGVDRCVFTYVLNFVHRATYPAALCLGINRWNKGQFMQEKQVHCTVVSCTSVYNSGPDSLDIHVQAYAYTQKGEETM